MFSQNIFSIDQPFIYNNTWQDVLTAVIAFFISFFVLKLFKFYVIKKLEKLSKKTRTDLDDLIVSLLDKVGWSFYVIVSLYIALNFLTLPVIVVKIVYYLLLVVLVYYAIKILQGFIDYFTHQIIIKRQVEEKKKNIDTSLIDLLNKAAKATLWVVAILLTLHNFGYNISALIAGLGIGGIAIAFALQNVLSDIFASFSIYFDKPFQTGDFIVVGDDMGVVERIGIKSTRLRTLQGEELVISNKELTESRVHNYKKMRKRRVVFKFGVTYETPLAKLKKIPGIVKDIINKIPLAEVDRVHFHEFGDFSLVFEVVYYIKSSDYNTYMDIQQDINLKIMERFKKLGIEMAYPTQTIYLHKAK
ncbi:mechanosensitive ion channel family protein [Candidatus Woesearchaeota archaeon]|nr:mechanosensitive ion channel family protein [Candidatus Woesearchaeota archaeon]